MFTEEQIKTVAALDVPEQRHMSKEEKYDSAGTMIADLYRLAKEDGCIAAGCALSWIQSAIEKLKPRTPELNPDLIGVMQKPIYLATPYSHSDKTIMESRFDQACKIAGKLMLDGHVIFSPIAHMHPIAVLYDLPRGWDFWHKYDVAMLQASSKFIVAKMEGWEQSKGIAGEINIAKSLKLPVEFMEVE